MAEFIKSTLLAFAMLSSLMGIWMFFASFAKNERYAKELRIWSFGSLLIGIAYILFASRGHIDLFWSLLVGNGLFVAAYTLFGHAISRLFKQTLPWTWVSLPVFLVLIILFWVEIIWKDPSWRVLLLAGLTLPIWSVSLHHCYKQWRISPSAHTLAMTLFFTSVLAVSFLRVTSAILKGYFGYDGLPDESAFWLGTAVLIYSPLLLTIGFFLICSEQTELILTQLSMTDPLTGILNRRAAMVISAKAFSSSLRHERAIACITMDLDHFKSINDSHGHSAGDEVLISIANLISKRKRHEDVFARTGGEEFVLFLPDTQYNEALSMAEMYRKDIESNLTVYKGKELQVTASFGVSVRLQDELDVQHLFDRADKALYHAKANGRNRVSCQC